ncbi:MAG: hypothetical protein ACI9EF_003231 [Pseudohongiellaceae bacterium]|jgi:hypothetical protein
MTPRRYLAFETESETAKLPQRNNILNWTRG